MNLATVSATNALAGVTNLLGGGTLSLYASSSGMLPTSPETALTGVTLLATFTFLSPAFGPSTFSGGNEQQTALFQSNSVQPVANGTVVFARATMATTPWAQTSAYTVGKIVTNGSGLYYCTKAGTSSTGAGNGPTGTTASITDSGCQWQYLGLATSTTVADFSVGVSGTDILIGNVTINVSIQITISSFLLQLPAV